MKQRFLTLGLALLLPVATAQTSSAPAPTSPAVPTLPPAAQPAAPVNAAPANTAPVNPAPVVSPPAPPSAPSTPTLTLNAPVDSSVELQSIITSRITVNAVQVSAAPGAKVSQSRLNAVRREMTQAMQKMNRASTQAIRGKVFYKVASRDAAGNTVLVSTVVAAIPTSAGAKAGSTLLKITQTVAPDGQVSQPSIESDNPQLNALYKTLSAERLHQLAEQNGAGFSGIYGVPLVAGQPRRNTVSLDAQSLLTGLLGAVAGPNGQAAFGKVQASPLTVTTSNTYTGQNAQGQYTFATSSQFADWRLTLNGKGRAPTIAMQLAQAQASGQSVYMPGGLPIAADQKTAMQMNMTMTLEGIQIAMQMTIDQGVSLQPR